jgi:sulfite reductase beta subunit-like hemoprotein
MYVIATPGKFMMRLRVPNGILNSQQLRYFADVVEPYGPEVMMMLILMMMILLYERYMLVRI